MSDLILRRGDVVICAFSGDYGKPRPAVVVQSNAFNQAHESVALCPMTSDLTGLELFRVPIPRSETSGLQSDSEVMVDKIVASKRIRIRNRIGRLTSGQLNSLDAALRSWLDLPERT
jgi:mRNA interferase MazF